ncbi:probable LRR receptor-like serine/threonine-protein kinase At1g06840 isoform X2 [Ricinus communis]|uniref:non-specific serine/threonine protein kinase n=1 Tax=Ricinus communis TaxID=3988 RepID=B9T0N7_RICCO|nr:probable LRR receptor-like serine/threonine-protein kinase At1g06840 isoform X2 [Ricinus communis]EEF30563.1 ATP binding protein, putative [Ricinus communis]|eukprot:XP_002531806.1 probable LRR receptor-like serine/threonine-protein kinase At1g06840 isoform X2 [Ricinus communis]
MKMLRLRISGCVFLVSFCYLLLLALAQSTDPSEVNALLAVKKSLIDPMKNLWNWEKGDPCTSNWTGVVCYETSGTDKYLHVGELQLLNMNLSGNLAPQLGQLSQLRILDFMWNELDGSIPKEIGNISSLRLLLLNGNKLSGALPDELGFLSNLRRFQVDQNKISGPIPKSYANLSSVRHIHFNNNSINGQIPPELSKLSALLHLLLDNNNLSGHLPPELSNLSELRILQLDNNNFSGSEIPPTYGNISKLAKLSLRNCSLRGAIPDLSNISNLYYIDMSWNQLTGPIPSELSDNMTTIDLSNNRLNGSIPGSYSNLPLLQRLSLENNLFTGSVPANFWKNMSSTSDRLTLDLRNNSLSNILGELNPPVNVTLRLRGNPICNRANMPNISQFCGPEAEADGTTESSTNSTTSCPTQTCPIDNFYEFVPASPVWCFCASPLTIGYRLKSPSFSYFPTYIYSFEEYLASALKLNPYQVYIVSFFWEKGPRLRMYLKLYPAWNDAHSNTFNSTEVQRIRGVFTSWTFPRTDFFGPYELLNFTLQGPYSQISIGTQSTKISKGVWAAIIIGAISFTVIASVIVTILILRRHAGYERNLSRKRLSSKISMKIDGVKFFTFKEMTLATNNFNSSTQVGRGGYGKVYRGILADNTVVAIKRAEEDSLQGQKEFLTEIRLLSRLHHRNLVSLVGYCDEEEEQMLVYEFMANGTLRDWLSAKGKEKLNFAMRLKIALGSAKGILYLHAEANPPVFHRDIKATNILLDSKLTAKVADFGLSRLAPVLDDEGNLPNHVSTVVKGTPGYLDPEYFLTHKLTDKSDVYSLGIVFLELLTGMQPITHGKNIVREVTMAHQSGIMFSIIDSRMGAYPSECVERFIALALGCCHDNPENRPSMWEVVRELETILKMMPAKTDVIFSESTSLYSGSSTSTHFGNSASSSSFYTVNDEYASSQVSGSDLISGVIPSISPR